MGSVMWLCEKVLKKQKQRNLEGSATLCFVAEMAKVGKTTIKEKSEEELNSRRVEDILSTFARYFEMRSDELFSDPQVHPSLPLQPSSAPLELL